MERAPGIAQKMEGSALPGIALLLLPGMSAEQVDATSQESKECKRSNNHPEYSPSRRLLLIQRCSIFLDPRVRARVGERLNHRSQPALVAFLDCREPERLLGGRNRTQHFRRPQHRPCLREEHQLDAGAPIQHVGQAEQATGKRNGLQLAAMAASVRQSQDRRRDVRKLYPRAAPVRARMGQVIHVPRRVWSAPAKSRRLRKDGTAQVTQTDHPSKSPKYRVIPGWKDTKVPRFGPCSDRRVQST